MSAITRPVDHGPIHCAYLSKSRPKTISLEASLVDRLDMDGVLVMNPWQEMARSKAKKNNQQPLPGMLVLSRNHGLSVPGKLKSAIRD